LQAGEHFGVVVRVLGVDIVLSTVAGDIAVFIVDDLYKKIQLQYWATLQLNPIIKLWEKTLAEVLAFVI
jgi:hypothetical protein